MKFRNKYAEAIETFIHSEHPLMVPQWVAWRAGHLDHACARWCGGFLLAFLFFIFILISIMIDMNVNINKGGSSMASSTSTPSVSQVHTAEPRVQDTKGNASSSTEKHLQEAMQKASAFLDKHKFAHNPQGDPSRLCELLKDAIEVCKKRIKPLSENSFYSKHSTHYFEDLQDLYNGASGGSALSGPGGTTSSGNPMDSFPLDRLACLYETDKNQYCKELQSFLSTLSLSRGDRFELFIRCDSLIERYQANKKGYEQALDTRQAESAKEKAVIEKLQGHLDAVKTAMKTLESRQVEQK